MTLLTGWMAGMQGAQARINARESRNPANVFLRIREDTLSPHQVFGREVSSAVAQVRFIDHRLSYRPPQGPTHQAELRTPLFSRYELQTGTRDRGGLRYTDASTLDMNANTDVVLASSSETDVFRGEVVQSVQPGTRHRIRFGPILATSTGTVYDVLVRGNAVRFTVRHGALQVENGSHPILIEHDEQALVPETGAVPAPHQLSAEAVNAVFGWTSGIPAADVGEDLSLNGEGGYVAGFSSENSGNRGTWTIEHIIDGWLSQGWESADDDVSNQWVKVGFPGNAMYPISGVVVDPAATSGDPSTADLKDFEVRVSVTDTKDTSFATVFQGRCRPVDELQRFSFPQAVRARYVELFMVDNWGDPRRLAVAELEVVGIVAGFAQPHGVAVDSHGHIFVADTYNNRIQELDASGQVLKMWGGAGSAPGRLVRPESVAVDKQGNIYVADEGNNRIQEWSATGSLVKIWGMAGTGAGELLHPEGVAVDQRGTIFVADTANNRVQEFGHNGRVLAVWGGFGAGIGQFNDPTAIAVDAHDNVYVADTDNSRVQKLSLTGGVLALIGTGGRLDHPSGVAIDAAGNVDVVDSGYSRILKFSPTGILLATREGPGRARNQLLAPSGAALDTGGNLYVADQFNDRIVKQSPQGQVRAIYGKYATTAQELGQPFGIAVDRQGTIYITDVLDHRIQVRSPAGNVTAILGSYGDFSADPEQGLGRLYSPIGIAVDPRRHIYVAEFLNSRIQVLTMQKPLRVFSSPGAGTRQLKGPFGVALDARGNVYASDFTLDRVHEFTSNGMLIHVWGAAGAGPGQLDSPAGIAVAPDGSVYVADQGNARVEKFDPSGQFQWQVHAVDLAGEAVFRIPASVATDTAGRVYVADADRIIELSADGHVLRQILLPPTTAGSPTRAFWLAIDGHNDIYVVDGANDRVLKLAASGHVLAIWH